MLENEYMIDLLEALKEMSTEQLSQLIQDETAKDCPNDDLVLIALDILEDREKENPIQLGSKGIVAWKKYQSKVRSRHRKTILIWKPVMQVASVVLIITLLFTLLPTQVNAETWWERLARWTDDFFSFFNPNVSEVPEDVYVFQTDNEGLQQVYDAVVELGVTEPIVPMWIPNDNKLQDIQSISNPDQSIIIALFSNGYSELIFQINYFYEDVQYQYYKDDTQVDLFETHGTVFSILGNNKKKTVTWTKENIECALSIDCQEDTLYDIIESIYRWR